MAAMGDSAYCCRGSLPACGLPPKPLANTEHFIITNRGTATLLPPWVVIFNAVLAAVVVPV